MTDPYSHHMSCDDNFKKKAERVAALLNHDTWYIAVGAGLDMISQFAESHIKGKTNFIFCKRELGEAITNNPEFFDALCEPGVIEWLTDLVMIPKTHTATTSNTTLIP